MNINVMIEQETALSSLESKHKAGFSINPVNQSQDFRKVSKVFGSLTLSEYFRKVSPSRA